MLFYDAVARHVARLVGDPNQFKVISHSVKPMFQTGPRRQGFASQRTNRAPLTAVGRSEDLPMRRESGQMPNLLNLRLCAASRRSAPSCSTILG